MIIKKLKDIRLYGLIFTIASAVFVIVFSILFFDETRLQPFLYNAGVDSMGALICAALYFGCMSQKGEGIRAFRVLILFVSACFVVNAVICYTEFVPDSRTLCFIFCLLSKLFDLAMIFLFYLYVRETLGFEGKLARISEKLIPILLIVQTVVLLANIFTPVTFTVTAEGAYQDTAIDLIEEVYLAVTSVLTAIMILKSHNPFSQKAAALTFIILPLVEFILIGGSFGEAGQYGTVLMSLVIMYCVIFNAKSRKLASTETELNMATEIQTGIFLDSLPYILIAAAVVAALVIMVIRKRRSVED